MKSISRYTPLNLYFVTWEIGADLIYTPYYEKSIKRNITLHINLQTYLWINLGWSIFRISPKLARMILGLAFSKDLICSMVLKKFPFFWLGAFFPHEYFIRGNLSTLYCSDSSKIKNRHNTAVCKFDMLLHWNCNRQFYHIFEC